MQKHEHHLLLVWLIITGLISFLLVLAWHQNILYLLFSTDRSKLSVAIALLYCAVTIHCAIRSFYISSQINITQKIIVLLTQHKKTLSIVGDRVRIDDKVKIDNKEFLPDCLITNYIYDLLSKSNVTDEKNNNEARYTGSDHIDCYRAKLKSPHDMGWFAADIMIKLGLLGTIVGFILMLGSIANISDFDVTTMQKILAHMSSGMGTALYTTLAGLLCSICAATQYQILDHSADNLIDSIIQLTQIHIWPHLDS